MMLLQGLQEEATDLFVARQANTVTYEEVVTRLAACTGAFERLLGVEAGSISLIDQPVLEAWYGSPTRRPDGGDHRS
jgi:hypothetical protein